MRPTAQNIITQRWSETLLSRPIGESKKEMKSTNRTKHCREEIQPIEERRWTSGSKRSLFLTEWVKDLHLCKICTDWPISFVRSARCHVTSRTVTSGTQSNSSIYSKLNIHISQLIATANQKANPEVTVQEMTGHHRVQCIEIERESGKTLNVIT